MEQEFFINNNNIGRTLKLLRRQKGISQDRLSKKIGITQSLISRIENTDKNVYFNTIEKIFIELGFKIKITGKRSITEGETKNKLAENIIEEKIRHKERMLELKSKLKTLNQ